MKDKKWKGGKAKRQPAEWRVGRAGGFHWEVTARPGIFVHLY